MKLHPLAHAVGLTLLGTLALFINASSSERPLRRFDTALLPMLSERSPSLLKGMDLSREGLAMPWLPIRLEGQDLSGMDLREARFPAGGAKDLRLAGAHLNRAVFQCVPMQRVDLSGANLSQAQFNYNCAGSRSSRDDCLILGQRPSCTILQVHLRGANLSEAMLQGQTIEPSLASLDNTAGSPKQAMRQCRHWLVIEGEMEGARLDQATLRCVVLRNRSWKSSTHPTAPQSSSTPNTAKPNSSAPNSSAPDYAGISLIKSLLENVVLDQGNFQFSDFWQARLERLVVDRSNGLQLGFTSMAGLQCPQQGCELWFYPTPPQPPVQPPDLSLNVRGSRIRSNLLPAEETSQGPILLCRPQAGAANNSADSSWTTAAYSEPTQTAGRQASCNPRDGMWQTLAAK